MVVNYAVTLLIIRSSLDYSVQLAALIGIVAGMGFNYLCTRYLIFRFKSANPELYRASLRRP
jgi:putative flippase GtrA